MDLQSRFYLNLQLQFHTRIFYNYKLRLMHAL